MKTKLYILCLTLLAACAGMGYAEQWLTACVLGFELFMVVGMFPLIVFEEEFAQEKFKIKLD